MITLHVHNQKPESRARSFWAGVLAGVLLMALAYITGLRVRVGKCDGEGVSLLELLERQPAKKTDRLPIEAMEAEHG